MESRSLPETTVKLRELHDVTREMMRSETKPALFRTVTAAASDLLGFEYNTVRRYDRNRNTLVPAAVSPKLRSQSGQRRAYERGETVQWRAVDEGEMLVFQEVSTIDDDADRNGDGSMIVVPLAEYGVLTMGSPEPRSIDADDRQIARVFGANVETAIERVERMQTLSEREAELAETNERLERFADKLSHELRNPLNVLAGRLQLAQRTGDPEHLDDLKRSVDRMDQLIDDLLSFTRHGTIEIEPARVPLAEVAAECWEGVRTREATLLIETEAQIRTDGNRLRQLLWNLFRNAVEHGGSDVTVTIDTTEDGFYVADDGRGIPATERDQLLSEGTAPLPHWTGLGLRIVSEVADAHGWTVGISTSSGGGARFDFQGVQRRQYRDTDQNDGRTDQHS